MMPLTCLRGKPTPYEREQVRIVDALIQYQYGRWSGKPRARFRDDGEIVDCVPPEVVAAALAEYDPAKPLRIDKPRTAAGRPWRGWRKPVAVRPICPECGSAQTISEGSNRQHVPKRWKCRNCDAAFLEAECTT